MVELMNCLVLICLLPSLTHGKSIVRTMKDDLRRVEETFDNQRKAKQISTDISSLKLSKIPHRIFLAGNEIIEGFDKQLSKNHVEMKFTYELVEPKLCEVFNPPFGCCWDNRTVALGPNGEDCPVCEDKKKSCRKWKDQCSSQVIKDTCPETCGICPKPKKSKCKDSLDQKGYCPLYARFGLCKRKQIRSVCKMSCDNCD